jgi:DNA-binding transcriptional regulator YhcF (GntR family)
MVQGDIGSFDTRFERLTRHYADAIARGDLKARDRFPSARELSEMHSVGRTTAGRVHGTLISMGLIEHRPGVGTFVLEQARKGRGAPTLKSAAEKFWRSLMLGTPGPSHKLSPMRSKNCGAHFVERETAVTAL